MMLALVLSLMLVTAAHAQLSTIGAAPSPSPGLGGVPGLPAAQCVIATPIAGSSNAMLLTPCPPLTPPVVDNTLPCPPQVTPPTSQLPAPAPAPASAAQSRTAPKKSLSMLEHALLPLFWILGLALTGCLLAAGTFLVFHIIHAHQRREDRRDRRDERDLGRPTEELKR